MTSSIAGAETLDQLPAETALTASPAAPSARPFTFLNDLGGHFIVFFAVTEAQIAA